MTLTNSIIGYSLLSGTSFSANSFGSPVLQESRVVREARAQFTLPETMPPWKSGDEKESLLSTVRRLPSIIDPPRTGPDALPVDVQTSFTAYKALDRLRILAEGSTRTGASTSLRQSLQESFGRGLEELRNYLATAASEKLDLSFSRPTRRAESIPISVEGSASTISGKGVLKTRHDPLPGVTGSEVLQITLSKSGGVTDVVTLDLSTTPLPPTLDSIALAINAAISSIPLLASNGSPVLDTDGNVMPRWKVSFTAQKIGELWGLSMNRLGFESVRIDQLGAPDALMVAAQRSGRENPASVQILRVEDPAEELELRNLSLLEAVDGDASDRLALADPKKETIVRSAMTAIASATGADGYTYAVGTTSGDVGTLLSDGRERLLLTQLTSEGDIVWQRSIGSSDGVRAAAISLSSDGDILVAGTATGLVDGVRTDGDMVVARYRPDGEERFSTVVRSIGSDLAQAVAGTADGGLVLGGQSADGKAVLARLDADGRLLQRQTLTGAEDERIEALTTEADGSVLLLTQGSGDGQLRRLDSDNLSEKASSAIAEGIFSSLAVGSDGEIAVGGRALTSDGTFEGRVLLLTPSLEQRSISIVSDGSDQVDSLTFLGSTIYAGGRTTGSHSATRYGPVDGFVARIDVPSGSLLSTRQFGRPGSETESVQVTAAPGGGGGVLGSLGLHRGMLTPQNAETLTARTSLRAGDEFAIRIGDDRPRIFRIEAGETLAELASRMTREAKGRVNVTTPSLGEGRVLRIEAKPGDSVELLAGADGRDALAKLGLAPTRLSVPPLAGDDDPQIRPGGTYGLDLTDVLSVGTVKDAGLALQRINAAISTTQSAYRSLYWDSAKAERLTRRLTGGAGAARFNAMAANYQAALDRLSGSFS